MTRQWVVPLIIMSLISMGLPSPAEAEDEIRLKPVDAYIAIFGGGNLPSKTDVTEVGPGTNLTVRDVELKQSATLGGKIGVYTTSFRTKTGLDFGYELDITNFSPDQKGNQIRSASGISGGIPVTAIVTNEVDINSTIVAVNLLVRKPFGVSQEMPNGRWFPYIGIGGGFQRTTFEFPGSIEEGRKTDPAFQALAGLKVVLGQHVALFGEYKFTHSSHKFESRDVGTGAITTDEFTFNVNHFVGGVSLHF